MAKYISIRHSEGTLLMKVDSICSIVESSVNKDVITFGLNNGMEFTITMSDAMLRVIDALNEVREDSDHINNKAIQSKNPEVSFGECQMTFGVEVMPIGRLNLYSRKLYKNGVHCGRIVYGQEGLYGQKMRSESELISVLKALDADKNAPSYS